MAAVFSLSAVFLPASVQASRSPVGFEVGEYVGDFVKEEETGRVWYISALNSRRYQIAEGDERVFEVLKEQAKVEPWYRIVTVPDVGSENEAKIKIGLKGLVYDENAPDLLWHIQKRAYLRQALRAPEDVVDYAEGAITVAEKDLYEYPIGYAVYDYSIPEPNKDKAENGVDGKPDLNKHISISIKEQRLRAYENGQLVNTFYISSGRWGYYTPRGNFSVLNKVPVVRYQWSYGNNHPDNYDLGNVPYNLRIMPHIYIHYAYWHNNFGKPMSRGCINVNLKDSKWIYRWADEDISVSIE